MARVPAYNEPQVAIRNTPEVRMAPQRIEGADADAFGAQAGRDMQQGAKVIGAINHEIQKEASRQQEIEDADQIFDKKNKFRTDLLSVHEQVKARQGSNAKGAAEWADAETQKIRDKYLGELGNDQQKKIFMQDAESIRLNTRESATAWERQQIDAGLDDKWQSAKELAVSHAAADPNPKNIAAIEAELQRSNAFQAQRKGWDAETLQNETRKDLTKLHSGVFSQIMATEDIGGAQAYMNAHRDKLDPEVVARADKWIHSEGLSAQGTAVADGLIASGVSYGDALQQVSDKYKGEDGEKILSKVRERYGDMEQIKRAKADDLNDKMTVIVSKEGAHKLSDADIDQLEQYDPQLAAIYREAKSEAVELAAAGAQSPKHSNAEKLVAASEAIQSGGITKDDQLAIYKPSLSEADYRRMESELKRKKEISSDEIKSAYKLYLPKDKQSDSKWSMEEKIAYQQFASMAELEVSDKADKKAAIEFARQWHTKGKIQGSGYFFDDKMTQGQAVLAGKADKFAETEELPKAFQAKQAPEAGKIYIQNGKRYKYDGQNYTEVP